MNLSGPTSPTLLHRLGASDPSAWNRFVFLYRPLVVYWCRQWTLRDGDLDDLVQEVLQVVLTDLARFEKWGETGSFRAWLRGVTRNKLLEYARRQRREPVALGGSDAAVRFDQVPFESLPDEGPEELGSLYFRAAETIRNDFSEQTWDIFWRIAVEGQSPVQVARDLDLRPPAVRMAKARVLRRLREELGEFNE